jgi:hypothetical protein
MLLTPVLCCCDPDSGGCQQLSWLQQMVLTRFQLIMSSRRYNSLSVDMISAGRGQICAELLGRG